MYNFFICTAKTKDVYLAMTIRVSGGCIQVSFFFMYILYFIKNIC